MRNGDVVVAHVEVPHTLRGIQLPTKIPAPPTDPKHLEALPAVGFNIATLASNHAYDQGDPGILDTIDTLQKLGIQTTGTGKNFAEARKPTLIEIGSN